MSRYINAVIEQIDILKKKQTSIANLAGHSQEAIDLAKTICELEKSISCYKVDEPEPKQ